MLDDLKLIKALLGIVDWHLTVSLIRAGWSENLAPDEVCALFRRNLLVKTLDGHQDDAMLIRLLQTVLGLFFVSDH